MNHFPGLIARKEALIELGRQLSEAVEILKIQGDKPDDQYIGLWNAINSASAQNAWFLKENILKALEIWGLTLRKEDVEKWISLYDLQENARAQKNVAVIMAGNIPLVGMHDFLTVLLAGHNFTGKLSSNDRFLLPAVADMLCRIEPRFADHIQFTEGQLQQFDAVIATGNDNSARYFEYYFSTVPHIIRKNRNGVAVLSGGETKEMLQLLGDDICSYFGLGCRNVSKIFAPAGFDITSVFSGIEHFREIFENHNKYMNNYQYHRSIFLLNSTDHFDNGFMLLNESDAYVSPIPVIFYEFYNNIHALSEQLNRDEEKLQCIVAEDFNHKLIIPFGKTQYPSLWDYADRVDTLQFLLGLLC